MYKYRGFGLCISSEIEFPELLPADFAIADVTIILGNVPEKLDGDQVATQAFSMVNKDEYLLTIKNICRYYAGYGNKIIAEPCAGTDERSIRLFLLGTVMAAILYQRDSIPLHASAIIKDGKLILFAGDSGAGKSTLLAWLATKSYEIFTDDVCVLHHKGTEGMTGTASYPMIKLWEDAIQQLGNDIFNKDFKVRPLLPKYGQFFYDTFHTESLPVDKIFILSPQGNTDTITIKRLGGIHAFKDMEKQAFKYQLITNTKLRSLHFSLLSQLVNEVPVFKVSRPMSGTNAALLADAVENLF